MSSIVSIFAWCKEKLIQNLPLMICVLTATLTRVILAVIQSFRSLPDSLSDAVRFERIGWDWSHGGLTGILSSIDITQSYVFSSIIAFIYYFTGRVPFAVQMFNTALGVFLVIVVYKLAKLLWNERSAVFAAWIVCLYPMLNIYSAVIMREMLVIFPLATSMLFFCSFAKNRKLGFLFAGIVLLFFSSVFHPAVLAVLVCLPLIIFPDLKKLSRIRALFLLVLSPLFIFGLFIFIKTYRIGAAKFGRLYHSPGNFIEVLQQRFVNPSDALQHRVDSFTSVECAEYGFQLFYCATLRIVEFLFKPFLWEVTRAFDFVRIAEVIMISFLGLFVVLNIKKIMQSRVHLFLLLSIVVLIVLFSFGSSEVMQAHRHRTKIVPLVVVLGSAAFFGRKPG